MLRKISTVLVLGRKSQYYDNFKNSDVSGTENCKTQFQCRKDPKIYRIQNLKT